ncbi:unnamed protein product, partial [Cyprideis torosa]
MGNTFSWKREEGGPVPIKQALNSRNVEGNQRGWQPPASQAAYVSRLLQDTLPNQVQAPYSRTPFTPINQPLMPRIVPRFPHSVSPNQSGIGNTRGMSVYLSSMSGRNPRLGLYPNVRLPGPPLPTLRRPVDRPVILPRGSSHFPLRARGPGDFDVMNSFPEDLEVVPPQSSAATSFSGNQLEFQPREGQEGLRRALAAASGRKRSAEDSFGAGDGLKRLCRESSEDGSQSESSTDSTDVLASRGRKRRTKQPGNRSKRRNGTVGWCRDPVRERAASACEVNPMSPFPSSEKRRRRPEEDVDLIRPSPAGPSQSPASPQQQKRRRGGSSPGEVSAVLSSLSSTCRQENRKRRAGPPTGEEGGKEKARKIKASRIPVPKTSVAAVQTEEAPTTPQAKDSKGSTPQSTKTPYVNPLRHVPTVIAMVEGIAATRKLEKQRVRSIVEAFLDDDESPPPSPTEEESSGTKQLGLSPITPSAPCAASSPNEAKSPPEIIRSISKRLETPVAPARSSAPPETVSTEAKATSTTVAPSANTTTASVPTTTSSSSSAASTTSSTVTATFSFKAPPPTTLSPLTQQLTSAPAIVVPF